MPDKKTYREKNGTTRVGDMLRWLSKQGKTVAPGLLDLAGTVTGIDGLKTLADDIRADSQLSPEDKELLLKQLEMDMADSQQVTDRWKFDMASDSWLSKNIRPLTLAFLTITLFIYIILDSSINGFSIKDQWIELLSGLLLLVYGGYFGARTAEKIFGGKK